MLKSVFFFYVHEHIYEKNIQFLLRCSKKGSSDISSDPTVV